MGFLNGVWRFVLTLRQCNKVTKNSGSNYLFIFEILLTGLNTVKPLLDVVEEWRNLEISFRSFNKSSTSPLRL